MFNALRGRDHCQAGGMRLKAGTYNMACTRVRVRVCACLCVRKCMCVLARLYINEGKYLNVRIHT